MVTRVATVAFQGIEAVPVDVQVQIAPGLPKFLMVGLPDKAVKESGERVRAALVAAGLGLPPKRITVNLAPADLPKEGNLLSDCSGFITNIRTQNQHVSYEFRQDKLLRLDHLGSDETCMC